MMDPHGRSAYGGIIHKLMYDCEIELKTKYRADDARIRSFPALSSRIADPEATQVRFKC